MDGRQRSVRCSVPLPTFGTGAQLVGNAPITVRTNSSTPCSQAVIPSENWQSPFKSTPPFVAWKSLSVMTFSDSALHLIGQQ